MKTDIKELEKKITSNEKKIQENENKIHRNTGALEILQTFKSDSQKFFTMWLITFITLIMAIGFIMFLLHR